MRIHWIGPAAQLAGIVVLGMTVGLSPLVAMSQEQAPEGAPTAAPAQPVLRDLESKGSHALSADEVKSLMPGARVSRLNGRGDTAYWSDDEGGSLIATSDNRSFGNVRTTQAHGKWNITDDGRYCVLIEWNRSNAEQWCRFLFKTSDGYYGASSATVGTARVYKLDISK